MPFLYQEKPEIQRPVSNLFIVASVMVALFLNSLPWDGVWLMLKPDFVAVVLLYWCTHKPLRIGIGISWAIGILSDVGDASLFGEHALSYTVLAFGGVVLSRRIRMFDLREQTTQVFLIFLLTYVVYGLVHWLVLGQMAWGYFFGCLTSTLLWIPMSTALQSMRQLRMDRE
ncbi:MAG: rod shape-determining protein MreD [Gallionella sp.]